MKLFLFSRDDLINKKIQEEHGVTAPLKTRQRSLPGRRSSIQKAGEGGGNKGCGRHPCFCSSRRLDSRRSYRSDPSDRYHGGTPADTCTAAFQFSLVAVITPMVRAPTVESPFNPWEKIAALYAYVTGRDFTIHCPATCDISMTPHCRL